MSAPKRQINISSGWPLTKGRSAAIAEFKLGGVPVSLLEEGEMMMFFYEIGDGLKLIIFKIQVTDSQ